MSRVAWKVPQLEEQYDDFEAHLVDLVNEHGQLVAAELLGLSQSSVSRYLKEWGYEKRSMWSKPEKVAS